MISSLSEVRDDSALEQTERHVWVSLRLSVFNGCESVVTGITLSLHYILSTVHVSLYFSVFISIIMFLCALMVGH